MQVLADTDTDGDCDDDGYGDHYCDDNDPISIVEMMEIVMVSTQMTMIQTHLHSSICRWRLELVV